MDFRSVSWLGFTTGRNCRWVTPAPAGRSGRIRGKAFATFAGCAFCSMSRHHIDINVSRRYLVGGAKG